MPLDLQRIVVLIVGVQVGYDLFTEDRTAANLSISRISTPSYY